MTAPAATDPEYDELLESLKLREATSRFAQVQEPCSRTFEWIFEETKLGFISWLESGNGLYWCRGHPASGKSTFMKWVFNDSRTIEALTKRDGRQVPANFFFHARGSEIQKSFKGLLQTIIYQILQNSRELLPLILPTRRNIIKRSETSWREEDLKIIFGIISKQNVLQLDVTLFLDALDEYDGDYETIATFLHSIITAENASFTRFKIFFSSRPLQVFLDRFGDASALDIQNYTAEDIRRVIQSRMSQNSRMSRYMQVERSGDSVLAIEIANQIFSRANGIFLWVILVLDELLHTAQGRVCFYDALRCTRFKRQC